jgi:ribosome biogenesis protein
MEAVAGCDGEKLTDATTARFRAVRPSPSQPSPPQNTKNTKQQAIPTNLARYGLSQVVNHLLGAEAEPTPFDFLVGGTLVRGPLDATLRALRCSAEAAVELEYILAVAPPRPSDDEPRSTGAWVTALAGGLGAQGAVVSGGADGRVLLWVGEGGAGGPLATRPATAAASHAGGVDAVATLVHAGGGPAGLLLSAGKDGRVVLSLEPRLAGAAEAARGGKAKAKAASADAPGVLLTRFVGHTSAVACLAVSPAADRFASAGWDGVVRLWRCDASVATDAVAAAADAPAPKKVRTGGGGGESPHGAGTATEEEARPVLELDGHTQAVSSAAWGAGDSLVTGSWDHSLRRWDAEAGRPTATLHTGGAVFCVAVPPGPSGASLAAFGGAGGGVRLWDERVSSSGQAAGPLRALAAHAGWVAAAAWHPSADHLFATGGHDGAVKLWDIRAGGVGDDDGAALPAPPLHTLAAADDGGRGKVLALAWAGPGRLVAGGEEGRVRSWEVGVV